MPTPLSSQRLVIESLDLFQAKRTRQSDDILPFLVSFQDVEGESVELLPSPSVLEDFPHTKKSIYTLFGMSILNLGTVL